MCAAHPTSRPNVVTIGDPLTAQVADLFNAIYETTLQALGRYFVHSGEADGQVTTLATTAKHPDELGDASARQPPQHPGVGPDRPSRSCGCPSTCCPTGKRPGRSLPSGWSSWPPGPTG
jgi:hypothetical protein